MDESIPKTDFLSSAETIPAKKGYIPPAILYELELETRAGTPLAPEGIDPLGLNGPLTSP